MSWNLEANKELYQALGDGNLDHFRLILEQYPDNLRTRKGYCLWLTEAAEAGLFDFVSSPLKNRLFAVDFKRPWRSTVFAIKVGW